MKSFFSLNTKALHNLDGWTHTHGTVDMEDQVWDPGISGFWYPWGVLESVLWSFQGTMWKLFHPVLSKSSLKAATWHVASLVAQTVKNLPAMQKTWVWSPGEGNGYALQYSCLENSKDNPRGCKHSDTTEWLTLSLFFKFRNVGCAWFPAPFLDPGSLNKESIFPITFRGTSRCSRNRWIPGRKHRFTTPRHEKPGRLTVYKSPPGDCGPRRAACSSSVSDAAGPRWTYLTPRTAPWGRYYHSSYCVLSCSVVSGSLQPHRL